MFTAVEIDRRLQRTIRPKSIFRKPVTTRSSVSSVRDVSVFTALSVRTAAVLASIPDVTELEGTKLG
jgi:hypothetical protein